jgi:Fe-S-cluster formation regulator IscX/YfhJ
MKVKPESPTRPSQGWPTKTVRFTDQHREIIRTDFNADNISDDGEEGLLAIVEQMAMLKTFSESDQWTQI